MNNKLRGLRISWRKYLLEELSVSELIEKTVDCMVNLGAIPPVPQNTNEQIENVHQQTHGGSAQICLCDDCVVESCDMRGEAVECSGRVTANGKLHHA